MPRGIPNNEKAAARVASGLQPTVKLSIELNQADHDELVRLARNEYRTPALQAAFLLANGLRLARARSNGSVPASVKEQVERLTTYAASKADE